MMPAFFAGPFVGGLVAEALGVPEWVGVGARIGVPQLDCRWLVAPSATTGGGSSMVDLGQTKVHTMPLT
jgi:hypothetical protein